MNLLQFIAIVLGVVGVLQLIKVVGIPRFKLLLSYGRNAFTSQPHQTSSSATTSTDSISEAVSSQTNTSEAPLQKTPVANDDSTTVAQETLPSSATPDNGSEIDAALNDVVFEDHSGQHIPEIRVISDYTQLMVDQSEQAEVTQAAGLPAADPADLYAVVQQAVTRLEQQMNELYAMQLQQIQSLQAAMVAPAKEALNKTLPDTGEIDLTSTPILSPQDGNSLLGGGINAQLEVVGEAPSFLKLEECGGSLPADAIMFYEMDEVQEQPDQEPLRGVEINQYFYSLLKTKEMASELGEAIKLGKPARIVKYRARQVVRSIEHYGQQSDANVAVAMLSMLSPLGTDALTEYDDDLSMIGRVLGMSAPQEDELSEEVPVEAEEANGATDPSDRPDFVEPTIDSGQNELLDESGSATESEAKGQLPLWDFHNSLTEEESD